MRCPINSGERVFVLHYQGHDVLEAVALGHAHEGHILVAFDCPGGDIVLDEEGESPYVQSIPEAQVLSAQEWLERK